VLLELRLFGLGEDHSDGFHSWVGRWLFNDRYIRIPWCLRFGKISSDSLKVAGSPLLFHHLLGWDIFVVG